MIETGEGFELEGVVEGEGERGVVVCHPHPAFGGTMDTPLVAALAGAIARAGMCAIRFNFRGIGRSGGRAEGGAVEERDVAAACAHLAGRGVKEIAVAGYSFGALMAGKAIGRGLVAPRSFVAIGFPTTIVGDHADRIRDIEQALEAAPSLLVSGSDDQFCEIARLASWCEGRPRAELVVLEGAGHFFSGAGLDEVIRRAVDFLRR